MSTNKRLVIGEGFISGYISIFLGVLSILAVFCFHYPEFFTTPEFREVYTGEMMKAILMGVIIASFFFATLSFLLSNKKQLAVIGILLSALAIALGGFNVQPRSVDKTLWHIGLDWLLIDLLLLSIIFVPIEMAFPKNKNQSRFHEEWRTDLVYFVISHLFVQFFGVITQAPAKLLFGRVGLDQIHAWVQSLPFAVEFLLALFVTDLFQYWAHRIFHSHVYLWRFHSVHHSTRAMDWLAGSRTHFVDIFVTRSISFLPLYICGFSEIVFNTYIIFVSIHAVLIHANTSINFGFLKYIFVTPQFHHWHHCEDPAHYGKNFAIHFPLIDRIFGTYYLPGNVWPETTGVKEGNYPKGYLRQLVYPFTKSPFDNDLNMDDSSKR
ncbi:sterol desaturase family protein [Cytophagaceae bacterium YF14B1]|uniref:Sterol desaturase family protein n=1 Tax=Xanthocytophaga flava TaxID=3048013 RepID=A0AAE3QKQ5_9BACT|nr:sterol desaturase family protein [Xanthocytophaga flavus]MDJ1466563.1 sterol desaturase family protein [Xanthocytophaga flavus]MDJ1479218.1 sterol desaturase family protein [Xanthocytophaga flavus]